MQNTISSVIKIFSTQLISTKMKKDLVYKVVKNESQYNKYCKILEELVFRNRKSDEDEIELLTLLIEKWDDDNYALPDQDPVQVLKSLMKDHGIIAKDLVDILGLSKGTVSKILNYQKGISKETIRTLSVYFRLNQSAFNRSYKLRDPINRKYKNAALMNTEKKLEGVV